MWIWWIQQNIFSKRSCSNCQFFSTRQIDFLFVKQDLELKNVYRPQETKKKGHRFHNSTQRLFFSSWHHFYPLFVKKGILYYYLFNWLGKSWLIIVVYFAIVGTQLCLPDSLAKIFVRWWPSVNSFEHFPHYDLG